MGRVARPLTVVMPVYNEGRGIEAVVRELERSVLDEISDAQLIVVDDASTDETAAVLGRLGRANGRIRVETSPRNRGHGPSVLRALELADGEWIFQLDSDGQSVVSDFWKLWERRSEGDLIVGRRHARKDPRHRLALSWTVSRTVSLLGAPGVTDANSPYRLIRGKLWDDVEPFVRGVPLAPSAMTTLAAARRGWRLLEVPVTHLERAHGRSSFRPLGLAFFSARGLTELVRLRARLARGRRRKRG